MVYINVLPINSTLYMVYYYSIYHTIDYIEVVLCISFLYSLPLCLIYIILHDTTRHKNTEAHTAEKLQDIHNIILYIPV